MFRSTPRTALLLVLVFASAVNAQIKSGTVTGIVRDEKAAVIPGASVVLTDEGLVTAGPGRQVGRPERLPARGKLRLISWPEDESCLLVNEIGQSWIVDRTGTYPRGPRLPAGMVSVADKFRRCIARLEGGGYAYWRDESKIQSWTEAVSSEISSDGRRVVVVLADRVEVYGEDSA